MQNESLNKIRTLKTKTIKKSDVVLSMIGRVCIMADYVFHNFYIRIGAPLKGEFLAAIILAISITVLRFFSLCRISTFSAKSIQVIFPKAHDLKKLVVFVGMLIFPIPEIAYFTNRVRAGMKVYTFLQSRNEEPGDEYGHNICLPDSVNWFLEGYPPLPESNELVYRIADCINRISSGFKATIDAKTNFLSIVSASGINYVVGVGKNNFCLKCQENNTADFALPQYWEIRETLGSQVLIFQHSFSDNDECNAENYAVSITDAINKIENSRRK